MGIDMGIGSICLQVHPAEHTASSKRTSAAPRRLDRGDVDLLMPIIASNARFASSPPAASASVSTLGVICQETPHLSLHQPHWLVVEWPPLWLRSRG
jgi:hypothetical protein